MIWWSEVLFFHRPKLRPFLLCETYILGDRFQEFLSLWMQVLQPRILFDLVYLIDNLTNVIICFVLAEVEFLSPLQHINIQLCLAVVSKPVLR